MKKLKDVFAILFAVSVIVFLQITGCNAIDKAEETTAEIGNLASSFKLEAVNGQEVSLEDYKGKNVLLSFGTTWCPYCLREIPELKDLYEKSQAMEVVYIDIQESRVKVEAFVKKNEIPYIVLLDTDGAVSKKYNVLGVPTNIIIDKKAVIRYQGHVIPKDPSAFWEE